METTSKNQHSWFWLGLADFLRVQGKRESFYPGMPLLDVDLTVLLLPQLSGWLLERKLMSQVPSAVRSPTEREDESPEHACCTEMTVFVEAESPCFGPFCCVYNVFAVNHVLRKKNWLKQIIFLNELIPPPWPLACFHIHLVRLLQAMCYMCLSIHSHTWTTQSSLLERCRPSCVRWPRLKHLPHKCWFLWRPVCTAHDHLPSLSNGFFFLLMR